MGKMVPRAHRHVPAFKVITAPEPGASIACLEWGAFSPAGVAPSQTLLDSLSPGVRATPHRVEETPGRWVFMPPRESRREAIRKVNELKRLGIREFFIVQEDSRFRFAISLGVFSTEDAAKNHLRRPQAQGVRTAKIGQRDTAVRKVFLQLRDFPRGARAKLGGLLQQYPGTVMRECAQAR